MTDYIALKWGTLKGYKIENKASRDILQKYLDIASEQKELLCELIRQHEGNIYNDWSGEDYTKDQAIEYLTNYHKT
jgi:hypothetical protein